MGRSRLSRCPESVVVDVTYALRPAVLLGVGSRYIVDFIRLDVLCEINVDWVVQSLA